MRSFKNIFFITVTASFILSSCKNDLKLNAPYKEFPSIYAVMNPQDKIQMIRVNKVFLGEGDANVMAQVADSVNYPAGELTVTLERFEGGNQVAAAKNGNLVVNFHDSVITTGPGAFSTTQRVYVTSERLYTWGDYVLKVTNNRTKNVFTAKTQALDSILPENHYAPLNNGHFYGDPTNTVIPNSDKSVWIDYSDLGPTYSIRISPNNSTIYQLALRIHYYDKMIAGATLYKYYYVDHPFSQQNKKDAASVGNQGPFLTNSFKAADLLNTMATALDKSSEPVANIDGRKIYRIDYIVYTSSQDYLDYLEFSAPSLSIAQEKPLYSNFEGKKALGIFAFRTRFHIAREVANPFIDRFASSCITHRFKFLNSLDFRPSNCN